MKLIFYEYIFQQKLTFWLFQCLMAQNRSQEGGTGTQKYNKFELVLSEKSIQEIKTSS